MKIKKCQAYRKKGKMVTVLLKTIAKHSIEIINPVESCMPTQANPLRLIEFGKKGHLGSH